MIIITGLPLFAKRLAEDLQSVDPSTRYVALDTYFSKKDRLKFLFLLPFAKAVISMNGVSDHSGSLDWVLRFRKKLVLQWMGTDILIAQERAESGTINRKYIEYAQNYADASWMKEELEEAGIKAEILHFKYAQPIEAKNKKYKALKVLSYVPQQSQDFYGIKAIISLAEAFPEIQFDIVGSERSDYSSPANMKFYGWTSEQAVKEKLAESAVFLRLTEHDGFSASVIEALSFGCEVLWTFPLSNVIYVEDRYNITPDFEKALTKVKERGLVPNSDNIKFISGMFSRENVLGAYVAKIKNS